MNIFVVGAVALAGGLGATLRFLVDSLFSAELRKSLPVGTMFINISGSFLLGLVTGLVVHGFDSHWAIFLGVGFLGGYTTFSSSSLETATLIQEKRAIPALINSLGLLAVSILSAWIGLKLIS